MKNWPYITYILDILKEISKEEFQYNPSSCLLHKYHKEDADQSSKPGTHSAMLHDMKSCEELVVEGPWGARAFLPIRKPETNAPSWYQRHMAWPSTSAPDEPQIISERSEESNPTKKIPQTTSAVYRIYIYWTPGMIVVDQAFSRTLKFDPSNHEQFKANLANTLETFTLPRPKALTAPMKWV
jgi:hypothetical protein